MASRRRVPAALIAALALVLSACAGMPTTGDVHLGRAVPAAGGLADLDVRVLPPAWKAGMTPAAVVAGYLRALVNDDDDYAIARSYLTSAASRDWHPDAGVTTYDDTDLRTSVIGKPSLRVQIQAPRLGRIDRRGDFESLPGTLRASFAMSRVGGNWRIDGLPDGVLLSSGDAQRAYRVADVYFLNRAGTTLVPARVLLRDSPQGIATALVTALLAGPGSWLAPAVRTAATPGISLVGNVPVHGEVADVNLTSAVRALSPSDLAALSAQVVWTLRQVAGISAVRLLADGSPITAPGQPLRQPVGGWAQFDPAAPAAWPGLLYLSHGRLHTTGVDGEQLARSDPGHVLAVARSREGGTLAVVQEWHNGARLLTGHIGSRLVPRLTAATVTTPTFDVDGDVVAVVTGGAGRRVVAVTADGRVRTLPVETPLVAAPVSTLRISPDGARVAAVVGSGRLLVGRVAGRGDTESFGGFQDISSGLRDVRGVGWLDPDTLAVTAQTGTGPRQVVETDIDGYSSRTSVLTGVTGTPVDVAAAPGRPLAVVTSLGRVWVDGARWRQVGSGGGAVYSN